MSVTVRIATRDDAAAIGPTLDDDLPDDGQQYAIHALPEFWSRGVGHALLAHAEQSLREFGFRPARRGAREERPRGILLRPPRQERAAV